MSIKEKVKNRLFLPVLGLILAFTTIFTPISANPAYADPIPTTTTQTPNNTQNTNTQPHNTQTPANTNTQNTPNATPNTTPTDPNNPENPENTSENAENGENSEEGTTCYNQVGALGWLLCPATGLLAKGIDFLYGLVEELLIVEPVNSEESSPVFIVWTYLRNMSNIVFIIFLLVIIYSQITGFGISNYGIKRALPKLIITAILVNISFHLCALAVDVSNILGASFRGLLTSIGENAIASGGFTGTSINVEVYDLFVAIAGTGVIAGLGIAVAGGALQLLLALIPVILGGIIAVLIGLATISLRQAVIILLVVVSPLAFVAYLLPNTEKWYQKWLNIFVQMLVFYPAFSLLFGVSRLAGWIFIAGADSALGVILGIAIQILPLFLAVSMMKMSGTILGAVSGALGKIGARATGAAKAYIDPYKNAKRAEQIARASERGFNPFSGASWMAHRARRVYRLNDRARLATEDAQNLNEEQLSALKRGTRVIGYDRSTGEAIYTSRPLSISSGTRAGTISDAAIRRAMTAEATNRAIKLRLANAKLRTDNVHNVLNDHLKENGVLEGEVLGRSSLNGEYFFRIDQATREKQNQDIADQRYVLNRYLHAMRRNPRGNAEIIDQVEYDDVIMQHLGSDGFKINQLTAEGKRNAFVSETNFTGSIYQSLSALQNGNIARGQAYLSHQVTNVVDKFYERARSQKDDDNIIAATGTLAQRGDYDKVKSGLLDYFNAGNVELGTESANRLALHFLGMKDGDPSIARFGKYINMETWAYTSGRRQEATVTYDQFDTGFVQITNPDGSRGFLYEVALDDNGFALHDANGRPIIALNSDGTPKLYQSKINLKTALEGTKLTGIDRTFYASLEAELKNITQDKLPPHIQVEKYRKEIEDMMMPQVVSALPTFLSGSEQIRTMVGHLVGMKFKNDQWVENIDATDPGQYEFEHRIMEHTYETYLKALTPRNLIDIKTDTWKGLVARLMADAKRYGKTFQERVVGDDGTVYDVGTLVYDPARQGQRDANGKDLNQKIGEEYAYSVLREKLNTQIERLASGSWSLENMKEAPRKALRIDNMRNERRDNGQPTGPTDAPYNGPTDDNNTPPTPPTPPASPTGPAPTNNGGNNGNNGNNTGNNNNGGGTPPTPAAPAPAPAPAPTPAPTNSATSAPSPTPAPAQPPADNATPNPLQGLISDGLTNFRGTNNTSAIERIVNEMLQSNQSMREMATTFKETLNDQTDSDDEVSNVTRALSEMQEHETDARMIQLLQAILDELREEHRDDNLPPTDLNHPTTH